MATDTPTLPDRPRIGSFVRSEASEKVVSDEIMSSVREFSRTQTAAASDMLKSDKDVEGYTPPETPIEKEARQRLALYGDMADMVSPVVDYHKYLQDIGVSEHEAALIVDDILTHGFYQETLPVSRKIDVVLRTRCHADTLRLYTAMQTRRPMYQDAIDELSIRYNMAASLGRFKAQIFRFPDARTDSEQREKMFDERLVFVENMSSPLFSRLSLLLAKFDRKIAAVMRDGVISNF